MCGSSERYYGYDVYIQIDGDETNHFAAARSSFVNPVPFAFSPPSASITSRFVKNAANTKLSIPPKKYLLK